MARRLLRPLVVAAFLAGGGTVLARALGYHLGPNTVVRCRRGHLSTTSWIPGLKLKGLDFGVARLQRCPVDNGHWSVVTPVRQSELTDAEHKLALAQHDLPIP